MSKGLLVVERMVLESLVKGEKNIQDLGDDTNLSQNLLSGIASTLVMRGIIRFKRGKYSLNLEEKGWVSEINAEECVKEEVKELFISLVNHYYADREKIQAGLKVQKVYMSESDEKIFNSLLYNLESFVKSLRENKKCAGKTCEQKVVMWGHSTYEGLLGSMLGAC